MESNFSPVGNTTSTPILFTKILLSNLLKFGFQVKVEFDAGFGN